MRKIVNNNKYPFISIDLIEINKKAETWEDAVKIAGQLLVNFGYAKETYIEAMIKTVHELGPYIVIYPGFALPHARSEEGAIHTGISFIRLINPVIFPKKEDDPVKCIIAFSSKESEDHIGLLRHIALLFRDEKNIQILCKAKRKENILKIFQENT